MVDGFVPNRPLVASLYNVDPGAATGASDRFDEGTSW